MRKISTREMRNVLPHLDEYLADEGELVITRRGKPIARLLPVGEAGVKPSHADLRSRIQRLGRGSEVLIREDRETR